MQTFPFSGGGAETDPVALAALATHEGEDRADNVHGLDTQLDAIEASVALKQDASTAATDAELATHAALTRTDNVHGLDTQLDAIDAAIALKQDAATAATDAELSAAVAGKVSDAVYIAEVILASPGATTAWTALDITAHRGAVVAKSAIIRLRVGGTTTGASYAVSHIETREKANNRRTSFLERSDVAHGAIAHGGINSAVFEIPVDANEQFDYQVSHGHGSSLISSISLLGYRT